MRDFWFCLANSNISIISSGKYSRSASCITTWEVGIKFLLKAKADPFPLFLPVLKSSIFSYFPAKFLAISWELSVELLSIRYIDDVVSYKTEEEYLTYLRSGDYDMRFLGSDYINGKYTGKDINIDIIWLDRETHNYSSTKLKTDIYNSVKEPMQRGYGYD